MSLRPIEEVAVDSSGRLLVKLSVSRPNDQMIYRAANGLRWDAAAKAFVAAEPNRWAHAELLKQMVRTLRDEMGDELCLTTATRWLNVPTSLQDEFAEILANGGADV